MTRERIIQMVGLVLDVNEIKGIKADITIGNAEENEIYFHDLRGAVNDCTIYRCDDKPDHTAGQINYISDMNFDAAEARIRQVLMEGEAYERP